MADSPLKRKDSTMQRDRVVVSPNPDGHGKCWSWTPEKERAVELFAKGFSYAKTAAVVGVHHNTLRLWMMVPEFAQAVDKEILETGMANKSNRIAVMKGMSDQLLEIFERKVEELMRSTASERIKDISSEIRDLMKQIAQEKEEYVEVSRQEHVGEVSVTSTVGDIETYLAGLEGDKRNILEKEFAKVADAVVASITQGLPQQPMAKPKKQDE